MEMISVQKIKCIVVNAVDLSSATWGTNRMLSNYSCIKFTALEGVTIACLYQRGCDPFKSSASSPLVEFVMPVGSALLYKTTTHVPAHNSLFRAESFRGSILHLSDS